MEDNGPLFKLKNPSFSSPCHGPSEKIEQQRIIRKLHTSMPRLGDIWILIEV
jgi:hypothetical protein